MITPGRIAPLLLALLLGAGPLLAQQDTTDTGSASAPDQESANKSGASPPPPSEPAPQSQGSRSNSPFDYRSSEEISEDVPVSFPVDI